jgi:hypothetical protein
LFTAGVRVLQSIFGFPGPQKWGKQYRLSSYHIPPRFVKAFLLLMLYILIAFRALNFFVIKILLLNIYSIDIRRLKQSNSSFI